MSNNIKRAINAGLDGLYVTQRDIDAVLCRARVGSASAKQRRPLRLSVVIATVMVMLLAGAAWTVSRRIGREEVLPPLSGPQEAIGQHISEERAVKLAEAYIRSQDGEHISLRDETQVRIRCELRSPDLTIGSWYYRVTFAALTIEGTDYTVDVAAAENAQEPILGWTRQRGVGEGHTAQEMLAGYSRVYGPDMLAWDWQVLNGYVAALRLSDRNSRSWEDTLMLDVTYLDPAEASWEPGKPPVTAAAERWGTTSRVLASYEGKQRWLYFLPETPSEDEGIRWAVVAEWDVEGEKLLTSRRYDADTTLGRRALIPHAVYTAHLQDDIADNSPRADRALLFGLAARHLRATREGAPDVTDPARYTLSLTGSPSYIGGFDSVEVLCTPVHSEDPTYWVRIDCCGEVTDSGMYRSPNDLDALRREIMTERWIHAGDLQTLQEKLRQQDGLTDPVALALLETEYTDSMYIDAAYAAVSQALGARRMSSSGWNILIVKDGARISKEAYYTDRGNYLVEYDCGQGRVLSAVEIPRTGWPWYAVCLLQSDMEARGIAPDPHYVPAAPDGDAAVDLPVKPVRGFRLDFLNDAFCRMYGPNLLTWTQAQLRTYQQYAILASGADSDMGILCLRKTTYPEIPDNAISREKAADLARAALALPDAVMDGAVLIGTPSGDPVWKVGLRCANGDLWFAEVDCLSGDVLTPWKWSGTATDESPYYDGKTTPEYWFREIVLEETIRECEQFWDRKSNG